MNESSHEHRAERSGLAEGGEASARPRQVADTVEPARSSPGGHTGHGGCCSEGGAVQRGQEGSTGDVNEGAHAGHGMGGHLYLLCS